MFHVCHHQPPNHHSRRCVSLKCRGLFRNPPHGAPEQPCKGHCVTVPALQMEQLRLREVKGSDHSPSKSERQHSHEESTPAWQATSPASRTFPLETGLNWLLNLKSRLSCPVVFLIYWRPVENILESHKNDERWQPSVLMWLLQWGKGFALGLNPVLIEPWNKYKGSAWEGLMWDKCVGRSALALSRAQSPPRTLFCLSRAHEEQPW